MSPLAVLRETAPSGGFPTELTMIKIGPYRLLVAQRWRDGGRGTGGVDRAPGTQPGACHNTDLRINKISVKKK